MIVSLKTVPLRLRLVFPIGDGQAKDLAGVTVYANGK
jgi:hypothetical protein